MFIEAKDDGGGGDNWTTGAISRVKLVKSSPPANRHPVLLVYIFTFLIDFRANTMQYCV